MSASGRFFEWEKKASHSKEGRLKGASVVRERRDGREGRTGFLESALSEIQLFFFPIPLPAILGEEGRGEVEGVRRYAEAA